MDAAARGNAPRAPSVIIHAMRAYYLIPLLVAVTAVAYWFLAYEAAGSVMLLIFAGAMALMGWVLLPTLADVGHTAPIDPDFEDPGR